MRTNKYGGKQLGHDGTFGVAFIPALKCDNTQVYSKGTIGKLFFKEDEANLTWEIIEKVYKIDPKQKFLLYSSERCDVFRDVAISQEPTLEKLLEKHNVKSRIKFQQHIMRHGGITLKHYLLESYSTTNKIGRAELIYLLQNLFYAVKKLQTYSFIHQDIKFLNIVISNKNRLRLIDFDLLNNTTEFYETPSTKIRDLYNGNVTEEFKEANEKFEAYYNKNTYIYNSTLEQADYEYVSPPEYYLFSSYMKYLIRKVKSNGKLGFLPHYSSSDVIAYNMTPKNYYEGDMSVFYNYLGLNNEDHKNDINVFVEEIKQEVQKPTVNPLKDYWIKNKLALKSDVFSIGLLILRICTLTQDIFKDAVNEPTNTINYIDSPANGPRVIKSPTSKSKQINVVDAFNILMKGLLWANPKNRFSINKALAWVKLICEFAEVNPFTKNKDNSVLLKEMKTKSSRNGTGNNTGKLNKSNDPEEIDLWFKELNKTPVRKSRFTIISTSTTHKY